MEVLEKEAHFVVHSKIIPNFAAENLVQSTPQTMHLDSFIYRAFRLYYDGFRSMTLGRTLWLVIAVKVFIIFFVLKLFFFPNFLRQHTEKGGEAEFVATELNKRAAPTLGGE